MPSRMKLLPPAFVVASLVLSSLGHAQQPAFDPSNTNLAPLQADPVPPIVSPSPTPDSGVTALLRETLGLMSQGKIDDALTKANTAVQMAPDDPDAYGIRGTIYSQKKQWDQAVADFQKVSQIDPKNVPAKFNIAEVAFRKKLYDQARVGFVALEQDPDLGELSTYKVFLCDLYGGREDAAKKELDGFDHAPRYFGNAAWALFHHQNDEARSWLASAAHIYPPKEANLFSASLFDLGYLPLPPPSAN